MALTRRRVSDPSALKALAHPVRLGLLELLVVDGPHTATEAAAELGETPANCSWHLRKLAEHGFVREVAGARGRSRPWRAVAEGLTWDDADDAADDADDHPETKAAGEALTDVVLERELQRLRAARAESPHEPAQWRDAVSVNQSRMWLTADEAAQISEEMVALFLRYADRVGDPTKRPPGSRPVSMVGWVAPSGPLPTVRADERPHERADDQIDEDDTADEDEGEGR